MTEHLPLILIELVLVFGGVLAFAVWQLRDVKRARAQAAARRQAEEQQRQAPAPNEPSQPNQPGPVPRDGKANQP